MEFNIKNIYGDQGIEMDSMETAHQLLFQILEPEIFEMFKDEVTNKDRYDHGVYLLDDYIVRILDLEIPFKHPIWDAYVAQVEGPHHVQGCFKNINPDVDTDCKCQEG